MMKRRCELLAVSSRCGWLTHNTRHEKGRLQPVKWPAKGLLIRIFLPHDLEQIPRWGPFSESRMVSQFELPGGVLPGRVIGELLPKNARVAAEVITPQGTISSRDPRFLLHESLDGRHGNCLGFDLDVV